jgi:hypothetical protein
MAKKSCNYSVNFGRPRKFCANKLALFVFQLFSVSLLVNFLPTNSIKTWKNGGGRSLNLAQKKKFLSLFLEGQMNFLKMFEVAGA